MASMCVAVTTQAFHHCLHNLGQPFYYAIYCILYMVLKIQEKKRNEMKEKCKIMKKGSKGESEGRRAGGWNGIE